MQGLQKRSVPAGGPELSTHLRVLEEFTEVVAICPMEAANAVRIGLEALEGSSKC